MIHWRSKRNDIVLSAVAFFVFLLSFGANIFGAGTYTGWFVDFQSDSNVIVEKSAQCKDEAPVFSGPVIPAARNTSEYMKYMSLAGGCNADDFQTYGSQFGLQARVISTFAPHNDDLLPRYFTLIRILLAVLTAAVLIAFLLKVAQLFGYKVSYFVLALLGMSTWLIGFASSSYWQAPLLLLPFVLSFILYPRFRNGQIWVFYLLLFGSLLLKLLNGYEYLTTILVSAFIPVVFYEFYSYGATKLVGLYKKAAVLLAVGLVAFASAITIHTASLVPRNGSWQGAFNIVAGRANDRAASVYDKRFAVISNFRDTAPEIYKVVDRVYDVDHLAEGQYNIAKYVVILAINYLSLPAISLPLDMKQPFGAIVESAGVLLTISLVALLWLRRHSRLTNAEKTALTHTFWLSLIGSLSWLIIMPGHAFPHAHINGILFYLPTLIVSYIIIAVALLEYIKGRKSYDRKV